ncbi:hypothetical protein DACRYDRAFT_18786 [Dacryopinax primogenitus]|uniref:Uncharacterized protein n=1 Tax=Dacryopinax primogenitus (strain DJM 731) TaxID=1858805 RepID=M5FR84_DACPD|nr:uncharacterized protein DACRYDRAFT_18786 [Dacryopinax primogenitus]EJT97414.1 hypothetical protein DACRYDRAFT_18786 [Dacryopinax primogenitus]
MVTTANPSASESSDGVVLWSPTLSSPMVVAHSLGSPATLAVSISDSRPTVQLTSPVDSLSPYAMILVLNLGAMSMFWQVLPFMSMFDATIILKQKLQMEKMHTKDLKQNDLVLIKSNISCFQDCQIADDFLLPSKSNSHTGCSSTSKTDSKWRATYLLKAVNMLVPAAFDADDVSDLEELRSDDAVISI